MGCIDIQDLTTPDEQVRFCFYRYDEIQSIPLTQNGAAMLPGTYLAQQGGGKRIGKFVFPAGMMTSKTYHLPRPLQWQAAMTFAISPAGQEFNGLDRYILLL